MLTHSHNLNINFLKYWLKNRRIPNYNVSTLFTLDGEMMDEIKFVGYKTLENGRIVENATIHVEIEELLSVVSDYLNNVGKNQYVESLINLGNFKFAIKVDVNNTEKTIISQSFPMYNIERYEDKNGHYYLVFQRKSKM